MRPAWWALAPACARNGLCHLSKNAPTCTEVLYTKGFLNDRHICIHIYIYTYISIYIYIYIYISTYTYIYTYIYI